MNSNIFLKKLYAKQIITSINGLTYRGIRCAGGHGHGHDEHHHEHRYEHVKSQSTKYKIPSDEDIKTELPQKGTMNEKIHQWIHGRWAVDRDDILENDNVKKLSAYYWFSKFSLLQNSLVLTLVRILFDNQRLHHKSHHESLGGVKTHENSLFLYKSNQADSLIRSRVVDYFILFGMASFITGQSGFILMPLFYMALFMPRKLAILNYFTFHAELLPHSEQVVFHKATLFGSIRRVFVDIKNLEKIEAEIIPSKLLFNINMFDSSMIFRDQETKEIFVFDANGLWNEDALKHKLLY